MNTREEMLARMRRSQPAPVALPELPAFAQGGGAAAAGFDAFCEALQRMGGKIAPAPAGGGADAAVRALFPTQSPAALDDVDVGVVRAAFGVAETGSVLLTETELQVEALGFLAQHLWCCWTRPRWWPRCTTPTATRPSRRRVTPSS